MKLQEYNRMILTEATATPAAVTGLIHDIQTKLGAGDCFALPTGSPAQNPFTRAIDALAASVTTATRTFGKSIPQYTTAIANCEAVSKDINKPAYELKATAIMKSGSPISTADPTLYGWLTAIENILINDIIGTTGFIQASGSEGAGVLPDGFVNSLGQLLSLFTKESAKSPAKQWHDFSTLTKAKKLFNSFFDNLKKLKDIEIPNTAAGTIDPVKAKKLTTYGGHNQAEFCNRLITIYHLADNTAAASTKAANAQSTLDLWNSLTSSGKDTKFTSGSDMLDVLAKSLNDIYTDLNAVVVPENTITTIDNTNIDAWIKWLEDFYKVPIEAAQETLNKIREFFTEKDDATKYSGTVKNWAEEFKKLEAEHDIDGIEKLWKEYFKQEWGFVSASGDGEPVRNLGRAVINELMRLGFSEKTNPFITFLKYNFEGAHNKLGLNAMNYPAIHNAYLNRYITNPILRNTTIDNILYNPDLYTKPAKDIVEYLQLQSELTGEDNKRYEEIINKFKVKELKDPNNYGQIGKVYTFLAALFIKGYSPLNLDAPATGSLRGNGGSKPLKPIDEIKNLIAECIGNTTVNWKESFAASIASVLGSKKEIANAILFLTIRTGSDPAIIAAANEWKEVKALTTFDMSKQSMLANLFGKYNITTTNVKAVIEDLATAGGLEHV